jgi:glycosyltransferase involved in cell wall biosynthesis
MSAPADVALLLEGTYPCVRGGVSTWVHQLIEALPELRFSLIFLGSSAAEQGELRYAVPANVVHLERHYLMDPAPAAQGQRRAKEKPAFAAARRLYQALAAGGPLPAVAAEVLARLGEPDGVTRDDFFCGLPAWNEICAAYRAGCPDQPFTDFFWTVRSMHAPLFQLADIARNVPPARQFHSVSTGYAGLLGAILAARTRRPLLLTEHGIYTKERKIDLAQASWIPEPAQVYGDAEGGYLRRLWIRFFESLGRLTYAAAGRIVALYEGNRERQIADGAPAARTRVVPNGIDVGRFADARARRPPAPPPVLALIGRVVPIKDAKTFIRAMRIVCQELPGAEGWLVGPTDEDPAYARECCALIDDLGLAGRVRLCGAQRVEEVLPRIGLNVLTSISEAMPLVVLEGFAAGVPAVATDVGACRALVLGEAGADRELGAAGAVVGIADPDAVAAAALALLGDSARWAAAQRSGIRRVEAFYRQEQVIASYRDLYREIA